MQFLLDGRDRGEKTLYVTLSENVHELEAVARSHGWSLEGIELFQFSQAESLKSEDQYTLYHPGEVELGETVKTVLERIESGSPSRVVFDSLSELKLLARDPLRYRRQMLALKEYFAGRACTVVLLDDLSAGGGDLQLQSLAHGVIFLELLPFEYGRARRRLRVVKFRGKPTIEGFHDFVIRRGGLQVFPQLAATGGGTAAVPDGELASGVAELDQLLGGGLSWGTTTLLIGPAGSGKSTLAAQYASGGTARAAVFLFDERSTTFISRCEALGMRIRDRIAAGTLT
jgi:circadian clock protein KaiC